MDSIYSVLTLEKGEFNVPFESAHRFAFEIEKITEILSCSQQYYQLGHKTSLNNINLRWFCASNSC